MKKRCHIMITGAVQGVGFRPFIFRLATNLNLFGWVMNDSHGVEIDIEGDKIKVDEFIKRVKTEKPIISYIQSLDIWQLPIKNYSNFEIKESNGGEKSVLILPDIATCPDCLSDILNPENKRFEYPFTNCTNCGPRYSIIDELPYDRIHTSMKDFNMCDDCLSEYRNPMNRRFHAQPNACSNCGPSLKLISNTNQLIEENKLALNQTVDWLLNGKIMAIKGVGGFHLMTIANQDSVIIELRKRKQRPSKPFALMVPSLEWAKKLCEINEKEAELLQSPECPIVLLKRRRDNLEMISEFVAPQNPYLGIMLPSNPLYHLLMKKINRPLIATSGNLSDEPICIHNEEALERLSFVADYFLIHDREIRRPVDDSIVRVVSDRVMIVRRARGLAPLPLPLENKRNIVAFGGHLKSTFTVAIKNNGFVSQHLGNLETELSVETFGKCVQDMMSLYEVTPEIIIHDLHPEYSSTIFSNKVKGDKVGVQHHVAHMMSVVQENQLHEPVLGVSWDGTGYGPDKSIWGSEIFVLENRKTKRVAALFPFYLLGGDKSSEEPLRSALGLLQQINWNKDGLELLSINGDKKKINQLKEIIDKNISVVSTTSMGRFFDGLSALFSIAPDKQFEGEAAMNLEFLAEKYGNKTRVNDPLPLIKNKQKKPYEPDYWIDWRPFVITLIKKLKEGELKEKLATDCHQILVNTIIHLSTITKIKNIAVSGGCFQNAFLLSDLITHSENIQRHIYTNQRIPANDGGISCGQVATVIQGVELLP